MKMINTMENTPAKVRKIIMHKVDEHTCKVTYVLSKGLSETAMDVLNKVRVLREYTDSTGFKTTRSQNDLIQSLDGDDLANVLFILKKDLQPEHSATNQAR